MSEWRNRFPWTRVSDNSADSYFDDFLTDFPGWREVSEIMCREVQAILDEEDCDARIIQLKEKFGSARLYYVTGLTPKGEIRDLVREWESQTAHICRKCGRPDTLRGQWYIECLCDECYGEQAEDN